MGSIHKKIEVKNLVTLPFKTELVTAGADATV